jgi:hypothetical protein
MHRIERKSRLFSWQFGGYYNNSCGPDGYLRAMFYDDVSGLSGIMILGIISSNLLTGNENH